MTKPTSCLIAELAQRDPDCGHTARHTSPASPPSSPPSPSSPRAVDEGIPLTFSRCRINGICPSPGRGLSVCESLVTTAARQARQPVTKHRDHGTLGQALRVTGMTQTPVLCLIHYAYEMQRRAGRVRSGQSSQSGAPQCLSQAEERHTSSSFANTQQLSFSLKKKKKKKRERKREEIVCIYVHKEIYFRCFCTFVGTL